MLCFRPLARHYRGLSVLPPPPPGRAPVRAAFLSCSDVSDGSSAGKKVDGMLSVSGAMKPLDRVRARTCCCDSRETLPWLRGKPLDIPAGGALGAWLRAAAAEAAGSPRRIAASVASAGRWVQPTPAPSRRPSTGSSRGCQVGCARADGKSLDKRPLIATDSLHIAKCALLASGASQATRTELSSPAPQWLDGHQLPGTSPSTRPPWNAGDSDDSAWN